VIVDGVGFVDISGVFDPVRSRWFYFSIGQAF